MRVLPIIFTIATLLIAGCDKDSYQSYPIINLVRINGDHVVQGGMVEIIIGFTHGDGDMSQGTLTYLRERTNINPIPDPINNDKEDLVTATLPEFPNRKKGEILLRIPYFDLDEDPNDSDTMFFKIVVEDRSGNQSDTLVTPSVIAVHQTFDGE